MKREKKANLGPKVKGKYRKKETVKSRKLKSAREITKKP